MIVSVVVPTFREAGQITAVLDHLASLPGAWEVIVSDGGSDDATAHLAAGHPSAPLVLLGGGGRAAQCNDALARCGGDVVLILHADSRLPRCAHAGIARALAADPACPGGNFALRFDGEDRFGRALTRFYAWQRRHGVYYGDSSVWLTRGALATLGGLREIAIMDDYDLVRRLERLGRTACVPGPATTSPRRWQRAGVVRTWASWGVIRWLFLAGVPPERLARLYAAVR